MARWQADGTLVYLGRNDYQVKVRGHRIELGEIEACLGQHPAVRAAAVLASQDRAGATTRLVAFLAVDQRAPLAAQQELMPRPLAAYVASRLPAYMVPAVFVTLSDLPRSPAGKIDRAALPALEAMHDAGATKVEPRNPIEEVLAAIWRDVLDGAEVGVHDNFFELGGHSLLATQVVSRVRKAFQVKVRVRHLFEKRTVAELAEYIVVLRRGRGGKGQEAPPLIEASRDGEIPLSFAQQRLWFLDRLLPGSATYNMPGAYRIAGDLDVARLSAAVTEIVRRHEALRTTFPNREGRPRQRIESPRPVALDVVDLTRLPTAARHSEAQRLIDAAAESPFALADDALLRTSLVRLQDDQHVLSVVMHHIVSDGWSHQVFYGELTALYDSLDAGAVPQLPIQYADFAVWQQSWLAGEVLENEIDHWRRQLEGIKSLQLPTDRPRPAEVSHRGAIRFSELDADLAQALERRGVEAGATFFMSVLTAFMVLISRLSGQRDVVLGSTIANRDQPELENLIGFFVNTLVLRGQLSAVTYSQLLEEVRAMALGAYSHQHLPFEKLVEELQPERDLARHPLIQVTFDLQNTGGATPELPGLELLPMPTEVSNVRFDMEWNLWKGDDGLRLSTTYNTDLFDSTTVARWMRSFAGLLRTFAQQPETVLDEAPLLSAGEEQQLLREWNDHRADFPRAGVHQLVGQRAIARPDAVGLVFPTGQGAPTGALHLSYGHLDQQARQLAGHLRARGVAVEQPVAVCLERSPEMVVAMLGIWHAGAAYVPLDPSHPSERLTHVVNDSGASLLLTDRASSAVLSFAGESILLDDWKATGTGEAAVSSPDNLAYVIYTSGSTGQPKGVPIDHYNLVNFLFSMARQPGLGSHDTLLAVTTISFDIAGLEIFLPLIRGARLVIGSRRLSSEPYELANVMARQRITVMQATPATWQGLVESDVVLDSELRVLCGGEALPADLARALKARTAQVWNVYGPTETTIWSAIERVEGELGTGAVSIGRPIANTGIDLVDQQLRRVPIGVVGELLIAGDGLTRGYFGQPSLSAQKIVPYEGGQRAGERWYRTGDLARCRVDGTLEFLGRVDHQIKIRGFRIELGEIEACLRQHPEIAEAVVLAGGREPGRKTYLTAYLTPSGSAEAEPRSRHLRTFLATKLPAYMVPSFFVELAAMPLNPSGKVDRRALAEHVTPRDEATAAADGHVAPRGPIEEMLVEIWRDVLGAAAAKTSQRIGVRDDFFELGGHSLIATRVLARMRRSIGIELPVRQLFERPTIEALAQAVEAELHGCPPAERPAIERAPRTLDIPLSFAQQRLWFLDQLDPNSPAYNLPLAWRFSGELDPQVLEATLAVIVNRHEVLRTSFPSEGGEPRQRIAAPRQWPLPIVDLTAIPNEVREDAARRLSSREAIRPFDLAAGPLWRSHLLALDRQDHVLFLNLHHSVTDGWSQQILLGELVAIYHFLADKGSEPAGDGISSVVPQLSIQYADFAVWQRQWLTEDVLGEHLTYWRSHLLGNDPPGGEGKEAPSGDQLPVLRLPSDRPRGMRRSYRGTSFVKRFPNQLGKKLRELGAGSGSSLYMVLVSAYLTLLYRLTHQRSIIVGSPIANRGRAETETLIGFFANTLAQRFDVFREEDRRLRRFSELLRHVRQVALAAYAHQDLPFERVVEDLQPGRDLAESPIFQVLLVLQNAPIEFAEEQRSSESQPGGSPSRLEMSPFAYATSTALFDLTLTIQEGDEGDLLASFEFATALFDRSTVERWAAAYGRLLVQVLEAPDAAIDQLPLLSPAEQHQLATEWNGDAAGDVDLEIFSERFELETQRALDRVAVVHGEQHLTYAALDQLSEQLATRLAGHGVGPEVPVAIALSRSLSAAIAVLAVVKSGGYFVPLDLSYPRDRLTWMLEKAGASIVIADRDAKGLDLAKEDLTVVSPLAGSSTEFSTSPTLQSREMSHGQTSHRTSRWKMRPDGLMYQVFTSGSTGEPKGIGMSHGVIDRLLGWQLEDSDIAGGATTLQFAPISFDVSIQELFSVWRQGGKLVVLDDAQRRDPAELLRTLIEQRVERFFLPFVALDQIAEYAVAREAPRALREVVVSGEQLRITPALRQFFGRLDTCRLVNQYGPSENHVVTSHDLPFSVDAWQLLPPIGAPIPNSQAHLLGPSHRRVPLGVVGELWLGGEAVARGYLRQPGLTAERFQPDSFAMKPGMRLYRSGDLARHGTSGELEFFGRIDHQVKIRGFRVEPGEVESALERHPEVGEAVVSAVSATEGVSRLVGYVVPAKVDQEIDTVKLRDFLADQLPSHMVPAEVVQLTHLPLTPSGKVDRRSLPQPDGQRPNLESTYVPPRTREEECLAEIWGEILQTETVGIRDDFFALGGHSLLAVRLMARVEQEFGVKLPLATLFQDSTIEGLSRALGNFSTSSSSSLITICAPSEESTRQPFFCFHPGGGTVLCYNNLSREVGAQQPFYALQARGVERDQPFHQSISAMVADYLDALREVQPEGPYALGGWSMGGLLSYEAARRLTEQGEAVSLLANFDGATPEPETKIPRARLLRYFAGDIGLPADHPALPWEELAEMSFEQTITHIFEIAQRNDLATGMDLDDIQHYFRLFLHNQELIQKHEPEPCAVDMVLFRAEEGLTGLPGVWNRPDLGWRDLAADVEIVVVPGNHANLMEEPNVSRLAEALTLFLPE